MMKKSGQSPFEFTYCEDLHVLPPKVLPLEEGLHGGFAVDTHPGDGHIYYGMAGCGLLRISPDLTKQDLIELPPEFHDTNFHSTKIAEFDGKRRLILPANKEAKVAVLTLEGDVDFILSRPEFEEYSDQEKPFSPTDTALLGERLFVADGYGSNYVSSADLRTQKWTGIFGGKTEDRDVHGKFAKAHGLNVTPEGDQLAIADRFLARLEISNFDGEVTESHFFPVDSRPCGINYLKRGEVWFAVLASLNDPQEGRAAPIYIVNSDYQIISTIRPKEELRVPRADHIHNAIWYEFDDQLYLLCQSWNPGYYFVLALSQ